MRQTVDNFSQRLLDELSAPVRFETAGEGPHVCPTCSAPFVTPVDALEVDDWHFAVKSRCPNCEWEGTSVYDDAALEQFDIGLDQGTKALLAALEEISMDNARDDFEKFASALDTDAILPEDF